MRKHDDKFYMERAISLARNAYGKTRPNPMVGAVIVKDDRIIGEGWHEKAGTPHAEVIAIQNAEESVEGSTLYVNLEPCCHQGATPPCIKLIISKKIARVVCSMEDPNPAVCGKGFRALAKAGIKVDFLSALEKESLRLNEQFATYHRLKRPFITCKWAMTLDGRIATDSGQSKWISNEESRRYSHHLRSYHDAIMVGIGTVINDDPQLNVRLHNYTGTQPMRIICDGHLRIPLYANCLKDISPDKVIIATTEGAPEDKKHRLLDAGYKVLMIDGNKGFINLRYLFDQLYDLKIQSVLCEGGSSLNGSLFENGFCDKLVAFVAPKLIGGSCNKGPISGWGVGKMSEALHLVDPSFSSIKSDMCIEGYVFGLLGNSPRDGLEYTNHSEASLR
ncbi:MAG: bifunctional diaminohydroxyphosphoribosylaminopyrimidine deaminase/5-amino-6-(5-phosphoribosylamino)uracil reductase RibD [Candidatus Sumerlaeales bacterium]|nr:bifunctional diaminohydroxyphosphoribosylaminopyrimidine deaminase/5-amino-6-(5-phosphoribosylamino)uracil reductase RibD [Candidatus Sumerlaeales bacterium]